MSILDKRLLLEDLEARLDDLVTAADLRKILAAAGEVLDGYQVESSQVPGADDSDGLVRLFLEAKASEGKSEKTIGRYRYVLGRLQTAVNVHPHRFRRTLATNLIDGGMAIQEVAVVLGHEKLDTTNGYVYTDQQNVEHAYRRCL